MVNLGLVKSKLLYVLRDDSGKIDRSDLFLLKSFRAICNKITVVLCGDFHLEAAMHTFGKSCDEIIVSDSEKCDFDILADEICCHRYDGYDELLFLNNSVFGPFYSMSEIIGKMRKKKYDIWGLTKTGEIVTEHWEFVPKHLQLYFFAIEREALYSHKLYDFFKKNVAESFEYDFSSYSEKCGFQLGVYIDIPEYNDNSVTKNFDLLYETSFQMIKEYGFPFLKKDYFIRKDFSHSNAADLSHTVDFIESENLYNVDLIWECILRKYNIGQIKNSMNLNFILSDDDNDIVQLSDEDYDKTAVVIHLAYKESIHRVVRYVIEIPDKIRKFFVVINEELRNFLDLELSRWNCENYEIRLMPLNRGRDMNSLFVICRDVWKDYIYLCFTHDKRTSGKTASDIVGKEFMNILWDNTLKSSGYIKNVLKLLKKRKRLGYLTVPPPYHAAYCEVIVRAWGDSFGITKELAKKMHIKVDISKEFLPFALGNAFWCKTEALCDITNYHLETDDFCEEPMPVDGTISHALERIMIYAAQNAGYYSGIIENTEFAQNELSNKNYMLEKIMKRLLAKPQFSGTTSFSKLVRYMDDDPLTDFLQNRKKLYIWGAGKTGREKAEIIEKMGYSVHGYICSEGYEKPKDIDKKVYYLSEIDCDDPEVGIILAIHKKFYGELKEDLEKIKEKLCFL